MQFPGITATYAALFGLVMLALSAWVIAGRVGMKSNFGDGPNNQLRGRVRAHGNFAEYLPLILILVGLLEMSQASPYAIHALLLPLLAVRIAHPFGMIAPDGTPQLFALRGGSTIVTLLVLGASSIMLLLRML